MKLKIKGLDCANCALKIEGSLKKETDLTNIVVDFVNQTISYEGTIEVAKVKEIVTKIEPDVIFLDDNHIKKYTYQLSGLSWASCAAKIERKLNADASINSALIDFPNQKLIIEFNEKDFNKVESIVKAIESDVTIIKDKQEHKKSEIEWKTPISVAIALILVILCLVIPMSNSIKFIITLIAYLIAGYDILIKLVKNLLKGQVFDENFLMGVATIAAFAIGDYNEAIMIMVFYKVGEFFQDLAVNRSRKSITNLMDIKAEYANIVIGDDIKQVDPNEVKIADVILVKPGEKIPLDGVVIEGESYLDTKALTGESVAVKAKVNDEILSGTINLDTVLKIKVTKEFNDSTVAKILDLVENSSANKAPTENFITKFARVYTPTVVVIALLVAIVPPLTFSSDGFYEWVYRALIFLVISCPCALVISIPLGFFGGIGNASRHGVLIKGANYLEALNNLETVVFDKTGTLTKGDFEVVNIVATNDDKDKLLEIAAYAEAYSNHPIAKSIAKAYNKEVDLKKIKDYEEISGQGISVKIADKIVLAGNYPLMENNKIVADKVQDAGTIIYLAQENKYLGYIEVADQIKEDTIAGLKELKALGINNLVMLTGDSETVAKSVAQKTGITKYFAKLLPNQKVEQFERLEQEKAAKAKIAFIGDGINDAPVLTRADVGIAMGGVGSDAAIESADIVIMNDEISKLPVAIKIAHKTKRIVNQNIILAFVVKIGALTLGLLGMAAIWQAVIADVGVAIIAIFNAMRVLNDRNI